MGAGLTPNYNLDTDNTLGGNNASDLVIASQKAIKSYTDANLLLKQDILTSANAGTDISITSGGGDVVDNGILISFTNDSGYVKGSELATVATSGDYDDLSDKPTIPIVNDATITFTQGGVNKGSITLNQSGDATIPLDAGGGTTTDVQINGTSITSNNIANIVTETAYNASTNKIATMADIPSISVIDGGNA